MGKQHCTEKQCKKCNGTGRCPKCNGKGCVCCKNIERKCAWCKGTGIHEQNNTPWPE